MDTYYIGGVGVAVGVISLLCVMILSIVVWCLWRKMKGEIKNLKYQLEKTMAQPGSMTDPNLVPLAPLNTEQQQQQPPATPTSQPVPVIVEDGRGYSSVNKLSLLPDSVRTTENLEGGTIPTAAEKALLEKYEREKLDYEERQLKLCEEKRADRGGVGVARNSGDTSNMSPRPTSAPVAAGKPSTLYYDSIELVEDRQQQTVADSAADEYGQPVDALHHPVQTPVMAVTPITSKALGGEGMQKNTIITPAVGQAYTPVYKPPPEAQVGMREHRAMSDLSPRHGYENSAVAPDVPGSYDTMGRVEGTKGVPSRRMAKEEVEFDPERQRMFRMTSKKGRSSKGESQVSGSTDEKHEAMEELDAPLLKQQQPAMMMRDYALVNKADKKKNRVGPDIGKVEGSGVPQRVTVQVSS